MPKVILEDETLRDGLQMEERIFTREEKTAIFNLLVEAGMKRIQVGSFVHPKAVPQMADTDPFIAGLRVPPGVLITGLILNEKGLERALKCGLKHVSMSVSVSDTHSRKNANRSSSEALAAMVPLITQARQMGLAVRAGVQCAFGCVYEGKVPEENVYAAAEALAKTGAEEINLADSTGMAIPSQVRRIVRRVREILPAQTLSLHLHDTRGLGLANLLSGYEEGVKIFDVCAGGLGGCPFIKGAAGNVPAEDAVHFLEAEGVETGVSLEKLCTVVEKLESLLNRRLPGRMTRVLQSRSGLR